VHLSPPRGKSNKEIVEPVGTVPKKADHSNMLIIDTSDHGELLGDDATHIYSLKEVI
jgi:hypothetical protein